MFHANERIKVLARMGYPQWDSTADMSKLNGVVGKVVSWNRRRWKPRWYHYVHRWWLTVALPYRDWKLPWRQHKRGRHEKDS